MNKSKLLKNVAMTLSLVVILTATIGGIYGFIVTSTNPLVNTFMPEQENVNGLVISKTVEHPLGSDYKIPDNIIFDFKVELGSYYANAELTTSQGAMTVDANGNLAITLHPNMPFSIEGLNEGTVVKVTELATELNGFALKDNTATKEVEIGADGNATLSFVNTYTPNAVKADNITVCGIKNLDGRDWQDGDMFSFKLEQQIEGSWTELASKSVTYDANNQDFNKFDFTDVITDLTFGKVGTYTFRVSEIVGDIDVDYDDTINYFTISVTDNDMNGSLEIDKVAGTENAKISEQNGAYTVYINFTNSADDIQPYLYGDADNNGTVDMYDASWILQYYTEKIDATTINLKASDVDGNGVVDMYDATLVLQFYTGKISKFPVEN